MDLETSLFNMAENYASTITPPRPGGSADDSDESNKRQKRVDVKTDSVHSDDLGDLWGYGVNRLERDRRRLMGVTLNAAVVTDERYSIPDREWRELDIGGFINLPVWLRQYEDGGERSSVEYDRLLKLHGIEDDGGYETDEEWRVKAVDRMVLEDVFVYGVNIAEIDFDVGCDVIEEAREDRRLRKAELNKADGESTADAMNRMYPDPEYTEEEKQYSKPRFSQAYKNKWRASNRY